MSSGVVITGLKTTLTGIAGAALNARGNFLGMLRDGLEGFGAVKVLAAGDEPDFELFEIDVAHSY